MSSNTNTTTTRCSSTTLGWLIWFSTTLFYFYEYYLRTAPSVMTHELAAYYHVHALGLGVLIGTYFYAYAPTQIIAGALVDRYGSKRILPLASFACAIGCLLFLSTNIYIAGFGRLLIGFGSGFGYVAILFIISNWISDKHLAFAIGLTQAMGMLGAITGQVFPAYLMMHSNMSNVWLSAAVVGFLLVVLLSLVVPSQPKHLAERYQSHGFSKIVKTLWLTLKHPQIWLAGCYGGLFFTPTTIFAMLWGVPFFETFYQFSTYTAAQMTSLVFIGWIVGAPLMGALSDYFHRRKPIMLVCLVAVFGLFCLLAYVPLSVGALRAALFLIGLFSSGQILTYAIAKQTMPSFATGSAVGCANFITFSWTALLTPLMGATLHYIQHRAHHFQHVTLQDYQLAMLWVPLSLLLATIAAIYIREPEKSA